VHAAGRRVPHFLGKAECGGEPVALGQRAGLSLGSRKSCKIHFG
jgi:hypothetical protein